MSPPSSVVGANGDHHGSKVVQINDGSRRNPDLNLVCASSDAREAHQEGRDGTVIEFLVEMVAGRAHLLAIEKELEGCCVRLEVDA